MRHRKKINHLGRKTAHRKSMLANMASSLIKHKRIVTTLAKAKALRVYLEPLVTKSKTANDAIITTINKEVEVVHADGTVAKVNRKINVSSSTHSRRVVFSYLKDKDAVKELFGTIAPAVASRPGGYLRILKTGFRQGDAAEMAMIEFVDFNDLALAGTKTKDAKKGTRRGRKKSSPKAEVTEVAVNAKATE